MKPNPFPKARALLYHRWSKRRSADGALSVRFHQHQAMIKPDAYYLERPPLPPEELEPIPEKQVWTDGVGGVGVGVGAGYRRGTDGEGLEVNSSGRPDCRCQLHS